MDILEACYMTFYRLWLHQKYIYWLQHLQKMTKKTVL